MFSCLSMLFPGWGRRFGPNPRADFDRVHLWHIRKTAGTALCHSFLATQTDDPVGAYERLAGRCRRTMRCGRMVVAGWCPKVLERGDHDFGFGHRATHEMRLPPRTLEVTCVRDPAERLLSHYRMLLGYRAVGSGHPCMRTEAEWLGDGFSDFLDNLPPRHLLNQLFMFSEALCPEEGAERLARCDVVLEHDDLPAGVGALSRRCGLALPLVRANVSAAPFAPSAAERSRLRDMLEPEYAMLGLWRQRAGSRFGWKAAPLVR